MIINELFVQSDKYKNIKNAHNLKAEMFMPYRITCHTISDINGVPKK